MVLRSEIKKWEHAFQKREGRRPTSEDIKKDRKVLEMYRAYHGTKKAASKRNEPPAQSSAPETAAPAATDEPGPPGGAKPPDGNEEEAIDTDVEQTPRKPKITEVFPTPQHQGRVMGLFDIVLPSTPQKAPSTPIKKVIMETPKSKRTPVYLTQAGPSLFDGESPLIPRRASKTISQLIEEAADMSDIEPEFQELVAQANAKAETEAQTEAEASGEAGAAENGKSVTGETKAPAYKKKGQKRTTRRTVMRPVTSDDQVSGRKASENYRSLKIQKKKPPFGRPSRR